MPGRVTLSVANSGHVGNDAQVTFYSQHTNTTGGPTPEQFAAQCICYLAYADVCATGTGISAVTYRAQGAPGSYGLNIADVVTASVDINDEVPSIPDWGGLNANIGQNGNTLGPVGTSICVSEYTALLSRRGRGRHFIPFIQRGRIANEGTFTSTAVDNVSQAWGTLFGGSYTWTLPWVMPNAVRSEAANVANDIVSVIARPIPSNLRSRRR